MKRQRSNNTETQTQTQTQTQTATSLQPGEKNEEGKKVKRAVEEANDKDMDIGGEVENLPGWDWLSSGGGATDELMPWGCFWSPLWGVEYVDLGHGGEFLTDIAWDEYDDIWNLKTVVEIPKP
ncbi:hypothetical protein V6N11_033346 [Hibiscus sabdariffa]|uniref:Uncharacterized protein n=1 Tax=Hibiscus sabdariffa TaxID=183260 RepID=A0ABR2PY72_9ROSI